MSFDIRVVNEAEIAAKLDPDTLIGAPLGEVYESYYQFGVSAIRSEAPRFTGALAASYRSEIQGESIPEIGQIRSLVRYGPWVHRHNPFLARAFGPAWSRILALLDEATARVEKTWST